MSKFIKFVALIFTTFSSPAFSAVLPIVPKIIGGSISNPGDWPWTAALIHTRATTNFKGQYCGGTLIAPQWVLTAGHCVESESIFSFKILLNSNQLDSTQNETFTPKAIYIHPNFNLTSLVNDIALIELNGSSGTQPIEILPSYSNQDQPGIYATAVGWGNLSTDSLFPSYPNSLRQVDLPIISNSVCNSAMGDILDTMICAGFSNGGKDTCDGDSGGPLMVYDGDGAVWRVAGVTSYGQGACASRGRYGVYTRVNKFNNFVANTICKPEQIPRPPVLNISVNGTQVNANWTKPAPATHFQLNYAPFPAGAPIYSMDMRQADRFITDLPRGSSYYVAMIAYNGNCKSDFSNIVNFTVQ